MVNRAVHIVNHEAEAPEHERGNVAGTVLKAFEVLEVLLAEPRGLGLTAAAQRAGMSKATTFRLLGALRQAGVVTQDGATGAYRPGLRLAEMAERVLESLDLPSVAQPYVERLAAELGHAVLAGVLDGPDVVYVAHASGRHELRVHRRVGGRRSVHFSSIGKAILAHLPADETAAILARCHFTRHTDYTIVDTAAFTAHLEAVRHRGWALVSDEDTLGVSSLSVPVFDRSGLPAGAIGISLPTITLADGVQERYVARLRETCRAASAELGAPGYLLSYGTGSGQV